MRKISLLVFTLLVLSTATVWGSSLSTLNYAKFSHPNGSFVKYVCSNSSGANCAGSAQITGTNWTVQYLSSSQAGYGVLHASATVSVTGGSTSGNPNVASVAGLATFQDALTFFTTTTNVNGVADFMYHINGSSTFSPGQSAGPQLDLVPVVNGVPETGQERTFGFDSHGNAYVPMNIIFGSPVSFEVDFYALAQISNWVPGAFAEANYYDTLTLDGITVTDADGNPINNFWITSESGTHYGPNGVPEPSALMLMGVGLAAMICLLRRSTRTINN
jgi:PEP-CTERM motif